MVRILQAFLPQLHGEQEYTQKLTFDTKMQCLVGSGFREISSRENDQLNLDVCKYFSFLGKACQSLGSAKSTLSAVQL